MSSELQTRVFDCPSEAQTEQLAETFSLALKRGDLVTLSGDLGAGKTTFARALIRNACGDPLLEVPSPTFTLVQSYDGMPFGTLAHMDLYRIEDPEELHELGLDDALETGVALIEWPQKAQHALANPVFAVTMEQGPQDEARQVTVTAAAPAMARLNRSHALRRFLDANGHATSTRRFFTGDASSRAYEIIEPQSGPSLVLMNAPAMPDGPIIRDGKPYSQIAHLAEDVRPFVGVALALQEKGLRPPQILASDLDEGILLIENLGSGTIIDDNRKPIAGRYLAAVETLVALHNQSWSPECPLPDGSVHRLPVFDRSAMLIEVDLLPQWYAPHQMGSALSPQQIAGFETIWNDLIDLLEPMEKSLVLRDYHSPNIIWRQEASGTDRTGLIDFQDAMIGPSAYDVASLAQDARVDVSVQLEQRLLDHYCALRPAMDRAAFETAYAIMAAQRATKILGIFVRLSQRDGKHVYLAHLPRIQDYLNRALAHPALASYRGWVESVMTGKARGDDDFRG